MRRPPHPRTLSRNPFAAACRAGTLGLAGLGEIGAVVLLITMLLLVLAGVGLVDGRALIRDDSAAATASSGPAESPIYDFAVAHEAETALLRRYRSGVELRSLRTGERLDPDGLSELDPTWVRSAALSPDGRRIGLGCANGSILFLEDPSGRRDVVVHEREQSVDSLEFSADGALAVSSSVDGAVRVWDIATGRLRHALQLAGCSGGAYTHVAFSRDGRFVAAATRSGPVSCWRTDDGHLIGCFSIEGLRGLAFSSDGESLVVPNMNQRNISRIDVRSGQEIWERMHPQRGGVYTAVATSPDGRWVAAGDSFGILRLLNAATGEILKSFEAHEAAVSCLQYSPDGSVLYSASHDGGVGVWNSPDLAERQHGSDSLSTDNTAAADVISRPGSTRS